MKGSNITGGKSDRGRAEEDFYATNPLDVENFLLSYNEQIKGKVLEPCIGAGHLAKTVKNLYPDVNIVGYDIVDRNSGFETHIQDFLKVESKEEFDCVITNPPYSLAEEFIRKSLDCVKNKGKVIMFLKLQFLEGVGRTELFNKFPPKYIYVCRKRASPLRMGSEIDPKTGKKWASSTICFAWFVWEKGSTTEPIIRWC